MVESVSGIAAEPDVVIAELVRPVIYDLILAFILEELGGGGSVLQTLPPFCPLLGFRF